MAASFMPPASAHLPPKIATLPAPPPSRHHRFETPDANLLPPAPLPPNQTKTTSTSKVSRSSKATISQSTTDKPIDKPADTSTDKPKRGLQDNETNRSMVQLIYAAVFFLGIALVYHHRSHLFEKKQSSTFSRFQVVTSGNSCAAHGLVAVTNPTECKQANGAVPGKIEEGNAILDQSRHDSPHGCFRNCWSGSCTRLDLNKQSTGLTQPCSNKLRCLCKSQ